MKLRTMANELVYRIVVHEDGDLSPATVARVKSDIFARSRRRVEVDALGDLADAFDVALFTKACPAADGAWFIRKKWLRLMRRPITEYELEQFGVYRIRMKNGLRRLPEGAHLRNLLPHEEGPRPGDIEQDAPATPRLALVG